jgi:transposase
MDMAVGVDTHKATLEAVALDGTGRALEGRRFVNDPSGHAELRRWLGSLGGRRVVGIECSGNYGAALARALLSAGEDVREVPGNLSHAETKLRAKGKSDPTDAQAIARITLREPALPPVKGTAHEDLRLLSDRRDQLVGARTAELNRIQASLVILAPGYQGSLGKLKHAKNLTKVLRMVQKDRSVRADLIRQSVTEVRRLTQAIAGFEGQIEDRLKASGTTLHHAPGIGCLLAARILGEVGDPAELRSAPGFARISGVAPIPASSGNTNRHRFDRRGNRQLNRAIYTIAVVRCRIDPATKAYVARKRAEGKTGREALRSLKRHIANELFRHMKSDCSTIEEAA